MAKRGFLKTSRGRFIIIFLSIFLVSVAGYFAWQEMKTGIVDRKLKKLVADKSDSLYTIKYDSIYFDEQKGQAFLSNIHIVADTTRVKLLDLETRPQVLADIRIASLKITGVKTGSAISGTEVVGDSLIIIDPDITLYLLKRVKKQTDINKEATALYRQILGNLNLIQVDKVQITNARVKAVDLATGYKDFDIINAAINLFDVRIDSAHDRDTARTLFTRHAYFHIDTFTTYDNGRGEAQLENIVFMGKEKILSVTKMSMTNHSDETGKGEQIVSVKHFVCTGWNSNAFVKDKMIVADTVKAGSVSFFRQKDMAKSLKSSRAKAGTEKDTTGFSKVYGIRVSSLYFPEILVRSAPSAGPQKVTFGSISLKVDNIKGDRLRDLKEQPLKHFGHINVSCRDIAFDYGKAAYNTVIDGLSFNSRNNTLYLKKFTFLPKLPEFLFAKNAAVQRDRYELRFSGIAMHGVNMESIMADKISGDLLSVDNSNIKVFRDLNYKLEPISKVGNYPHQILLASKIPINIKRAEFNNIRIEYDERNAISDSTGKVVFANSKLTINNITNDLKQIAEKRFTTIDFNSKVLGLLPFYIHLKLDLASADGSFEVYGNAGKMDARKLNIISKPLALVEIDHGVLNGLKFNFKGNDNLAKGDVEFLYDDLKIKLLKLNDSNTAFRRKTVMSFIANKFVKNNNPANGKKRSYIVQFDRDPYKSFFNLIWKTIFTGIQETLGLPGKRNATEKS